MYYNVVTWITNVLAVCCDGSPMDGATVTCVSVGVARRKYALVAALKTVDDGTRVLSLCKLQRAYK